MQFEAKIIEDSISPWGARLTTMQLCYPRFIHSEMMTHRVFSRNASSSRAIPVKKMIQMVREEPAMPVHWGANQPGMQAGTEVQHVGVAKDLWLRAARNAANLAEEMAQIGLHKQVANRILEPFQWMHVIVTATEWDNFFALRDHPDAEPNIQLLARMMKQAMTDSPPVFRWGCGYDATIWHLPYVNAEERSVFASGQENIRMLCMLSAARCARVSYLNHDGSVPNHDKDLALYERLVGGNPMHASPIEHQGHYLKKSGPEFSGNFRGWKQFRKIVEMELRLKHNELCQ